MMKKLILIAVLVGVLATLFAGTVLAAGPVNPQGPARGFGPGTGMGGMMRRGAPEWAGQPEELQALLGMTAEEIQAERLAGNSLVEIAQAKGVSEEKLIETILNAKKANLTELVDEGKLTQAQADYMIKQMQTRVETMVERTSVGPSFSSDQARSRMGQGFRGGCGANR